MFIVVHYTDINIRLDAIVAWTHVHHVVHYTKHCNTNCVPIDKSFHIRSRTVTFKGFVTFAQDNSTNQAADVLEKDRLQHPLDLVRVSHEWELH